jgi:hypothetical protein
MKKRALAWLVVVGLLSALLPSPVHAQGRKTGAIFDPTAYAQVPYKSTLTRGLYKYPPKASVKGFAPFAGDQGQYGTCTAWASAYAAVTIIYARMNGITDRTAITREAFSPGFAFRASFGGSFFGCDSGQVTARVLQSIQKNGVPFFSSLDSLCPSAIPQDAFDTAVHYSILGFTRIASPGDDRAIILQKIKKTISENKPVVVGMDVDDVPGKGCYATLSRSFIWIPDRSVEPTSGHAMTIVSYDDAYGGGAFELQNSWGRNFGNDGFFWIRYDDFVSYFEEAFELLENPEMANIGGTQLSGALSLVESDGHSPAVKWDGSQYVVKEDFPSGTRFRIYLDNNEPAFVYMIGVDSAGATYRLFPSDPGMSAALTYARNQVALPGENLFVQTDQNPGQERIVVLYSLTELDQAGIEKQIQAGKGTLFERLGAVLEGKLVPPDRVSFDPEKMVFKAKGRTNGVVALLVSINHTR